MKIRGFEKISSYKEVDFPLPSRQTARSAGYDIYLPETMEQSQMEHLHQLFLCKK